MNILFKKRLLTALTCFAAFLGVMIMLIAATVGHASSARADGNETDDPVISISASFLTTGEESPVIDTVRITNTGDVDVTLTAIGGIWIDNDNDGSYNSASVTLGDIAIEAGEYYDLPVTLTDEAENGYSLSFINAGLYKISYAPEGEDPAVYWFQYSDGLNTDDGGAAPAAPAPDMDAKIQEFLRNNWHWFAIGGGALVLLAFVGFRIKGR